MIGEPPVGASPADESAERPWWAALKSGEQASALVHLYRGEVARSNAWRQRLDATTNWAVITTGAAITFAFGTPDHPAAVILIVSVLTLLFLFIEARRYRYYELWSHRARLIESHFYCGLLVPSVRPTTAWTQELATSLLEPRFSIGLGEALGRRYRRNYAPLLIILAASWLLKVWIHPVSASGWNEFLARAAVGPISGSAVLTFGIVFHAALLVFGLSTVGLRDSDAEVFDRGIPGMRLFARLRAATRDALDVDLSAMRPKWSERRKRLVLIITDEQEKISRALIDELNRGVTAIDGTGMYSGRQRNVLLCVIEGRQVARLRAAVGDADPQAFVIVMPTNDVRGEGFRPLEV